MQHQDKPPSCSQQYSSSHLSRRFTCYALNGDIIYIRAVWRRFLPMSCIFCAGATARQSMFSSQPIIARVQAVALDEISAPQGHEASIVAAAPC